MTSKKKMSKTVIIIIVLVIVILLLMIVLLSVNRKNKENWLWGEVPETTIQTEEPISDDDSENLSPSINNPSMPTEQTDVDNNIIFPENVDYWEESLSGGGVPQTYTDGDKNNYTKQYFPSLGYAMYIPDDWKRIEHSDSYLQNTYYLVSEKENYENIQISITTKTATKGLSASEARNLFRNTHQNMEYYFKHGDYKFVTTMYETGTIHQITTDDIPGFEYLDTKVLVYYDEPKVTFVMDKEPTYFTEPYVINYYIIKENVAVMLTVIGPRKHAGNMNYLLATMGLNCKELYNTNATRIHYSTDTTFKTNLLTLKAPSEWIQALGNNDVLRIKCNGTENETSPLYGTEIIMSKSYVEKESGQKPQSILSDKNVTSNIAYSALDYNATITNMIMQNLNYSFKYSPSDVTEVIYGENLLTKINFSCSIDESSLINKLSIMENPFSGVIYIKDTPNGYVYVVVKYMKNNITYIDSLCDDILSNMTWPKSNQ